MLSACVLDAVSRLRLLASGLALAALAACATPGGEADEGFQSRPGGTRVSPDSVGACAVSREDRLLPQYVGLTEAEATQLGREEAVPVRTACRDGESLPVTADYRPGRVNLVVESGRALRAVEE